MTAAPKPPAPDVVRYDNVTDYRFGVGSIGYMEPCENGDFVRFEDFAALRGRLKRCEEALRQARYKINLVNSPGVVSPSVSNTLDEAMVWVNSALTKNLTGEALKWRLAQDIADDEKEADVKARNDNRSKCYEYDDRCWFNRFYGERCTKPAEWHWPTAPHMYGRACRWCSEHKHDNDVRIPAAKEADRG